MKRLVSGVAAALAILRRRWQRSRWTRRPIVRSMFMAITGPQTQVPQQQEVTYGGHT